MTVSEYINENLEKTVRLNTEDSGTLIGLPYPYTVPCISNDFSELYYWDTYFINLGLISDGRIELAKSNIDNMLWLIEKYGFMPNGSRTYYLTRSQPPFLYLGVRDIYSATGDIKWLSAAYNSLLKEYEFWQTKRSSPNGLNVYGNHSPMTDERIDTLYKVYLKRTGSSGGEGSEFRRNAAHLVYTYCESGWDCSSRFEFDGEFCNPVDLNSLLFGFERQMAQFCRILGNGKENEWEKRAENRKRIMDELLRESSGGFYLDYNFRTESLSPVISAASFFPAFVGITDDADGIQRLINLMLIKYGISASAPGPAVNGYQWDYPNIWAPLQYIAYEACLKCGCETAAREISRRYISLIDSSFEKNGDLWEKYDGNTGEVASQEYTAPSMLGWTAGVYLKFKNDLT